MLMSGPNVAGEEGPKMRQFKKYSLVTFKMNACFFQ